MNFEIVDYARRKVYTGKHGCSILTHRGLAFGCLQTEDGLYVAEKYLYPYNQIDVVTSFVESDILTVLESWLESDSDRELFDLAKGEGLFKGLHHFVEPSPSDNTLQSRYLF